MSLSVAIIGSDDIDDLSVNNIWAGITSNRFQIHGVDDSDNVAVLTLTKRQIRQIIETGRRYLEQNEGGG